MLPFLVASLTSKKAGCPRCGGLAHLENGECVSCLLLGALEPDDAASNEIDDLLASIDLRDSDWTLGNYQILEEIGRGGMGVIYRARQRHSKRIVALKRLLSYHSESRETLERFRREAEAAASLDHPNILPIFEVGEADDLPFFTMKLATGGSLQQVAAGLRGNVRDCVRLLMKVTRAVAYAHSEGILHRDLKPGNILLDARGEPMVSDFGLAKWLDRTTELTRSLTIFGTPGYIAPEQSHAAAAQLTPAADIYSLGAILFELVAGRPPFLGEHALAVIKQADEKPAPKLRSLVRSADRDLETICAKCLEHEPNLRYRCADDLAEDLQRWLEGKPIRARPVAAPLLAFRWIRRNPWYSAMLAGVAVLAIAAASLVTRSNALQSSVTFAQAARHSIMVEPVLDIERATPDSDLTQAVADALRAQLRGVGPAIVKTATSREFTENDQMTGNSRARSRLCSTIREKGGKIRVAVRLIDAPSGATAIKQVLEIATREEIPAAISRLIGQRIYTALDRDQLGDANANKEGAQTAELLHSARELMDRRTLPYLDRAEECVRRALEREPQSATALAYLSMIESSRVVLGSAQASLRRARELAQRAVELDEDSGEAHRAAASANILAARFEDALEHCYREIELNGLAKRSTSMIGQTYRELGRPDLALVWYNAGSEHEVQPAEFAEAVGDCWCELADDTRALRAYNRALAVRPDQPQGWLGICHVALLQGDLARARQLCDGGYKKYSDHSYAKQMAALTAFFTRDYGTAKVLYEQLLATEARGGGHFYADVTYETALARIARDNGDAASAAALLRQARDNESAALSENPRDPRALYSLAALEACADNGVAAVAALRAAAQNGWIHYRAARVDPRFDAVRADPEFARVLIDTEQRVQGMRRRLPAEIERDLVAQD